MAQEFQRIEKEFVLKTLLDAQDPISIHHRIQRFSGHLRSYNKETIILQVTDMKDTPRFKKETQVNLFFRFRNIAATCKVLFISSENDMYTFTIPAAMYRDLTRDHERIQVGNNISVSIIINGEHMSISFPASASYHAPEPPNTNKNFETPRISDLLKAFRERCKSFSSESNIITFRERKPATIIERILAVSGKAVVLPFDDLNNEKLMISCITPDDIDWIVDESEEDPTQLRSELEDHIKMMKAKEIFQEFYVPVLYYEFVVGYVYLMRGKTQKTAFSKEQMETVCQFSHLFSYSLKMNGYFKSEPVQEKFTSSELIDISASGLLFSYPPDAPIVNLYTDVDLVLKIHQKTLPLRGRIVRKFRDAGQVYLGVQFIDLQDKTRDILLRILYGEDFDSEIEIH